MQELPDSSLILTKSSTESVFLAFDGFSNMVLASAIEPLRAARDLGNHPALNWRLASLDGGPVRSSSGLSLSPDAALAECLPCATLFVVVGYGMREYTTTRILGSLRRSAQQTQAIGGLDSGAWLLAAAGLLNGRRATIHWQELGAFQESFPKVKVCSERFVMDGNRITAGGASTVLQLMLQLIRQRASDAVAFDVSNLFVYDVENNFRLGRGARDRAVFRVPQLEQAIMAMRRHMEQPLAIPDIAATVHLSARSLDRLFQRELGVSPGQYYQMIRLNLARSLVNETGLSVTEIATRTGFASAATLSRAYGQHFGQSIREARRGRLATAGF